MLFSRNKRKKITDDEFIQLFQTIGTTALAAHLGVDQRRIRERRAAVEASRGIILVAPDPAMAAESAHGGEIVSIPITDGCVLIGADGHYWPGQGPSTAHRAFVVFAKRNKPKAVIYNGDALDGASISRHPPIGWEHQPTLAQELEAAQERLGEIAIAAGRAERLWPLGNHDARFNTRLAMHAPEFRHVPGTRLVDHFPEWTPCWAVELGGPEGAFVKHRFKGGMHAPHNNALWAGRTIVTSHLHSQKVMPISQLGGRTIWGVDTGCLAAVHGQQFNYLEANPRNWRSGFCVLTWKKGRLLTPELVSVHSEKDGTVEWRGDIIKV